MNAHKPAIDDAEDSIFVLRKKLRKLRKDLEKVMDEAENLEVLITAERDKAAESKEQGHAAHT